MTEPNDHGLRAEGIDTECFDEWEWGPVPDDVIQKISIDAGKTVLEDIKQNGRLRLECSDGGDCSVHLLVGDNWDFWLLFSELVDNWILSARGTHPDDIRSLIAPLEEALAKVRALLDD